MTPDEIPPQLVELLDERAGRPHSRGGSVLRTLAEILTRYDELRAAPPVSEGVEGDFVPSARVIADSISDGHRLTTIEVRLHRFVLAEFNTHRALSRNSASSRAIPVHKTIARVREERVYPLSWPAEQRGMQGGEELTGRLLHETRETWDAARRLALAHAESLAGTVHKSVVNRLLEPFMSTTIVVSATEWENFFTQRCSPLAQPELRAAAQAMRHVYDLSTPTKLRLGHWHMPYVSAEELDEHGMVSCRAASAARCARVSYLTQAGTRDLHADLDLYRRLIEAQPPHNSPLEHVAAPDPYGWGRSNFAGWLQLRQYVQETCPSA